MNNFLRDFRKNNIDIKLNFTFNFVHLGAKKNKTTSFPILINFKTIGSIDKKLKLKYPRL